MTDSIEVIQKNIMEMGTYICINNDITNILLSDNTEELNRDAQVWLHQALRLGARDYLLKPVRSTIY